MLDKAAAIIALPGNLVVNSSATVRLVNVEQTPISRDVLVNSGGLFDFSTYYTYLDTLQGSGTVNFGVNGFIYVGFNNGSSEFDGSFTGVGNAGSYDGRKRRDRHIHDWRQQHLHRRHHSCALTVNSWSTESQPLIPVTVDNGATLGGSGTVGIISANGIISPGTAPSSSIAAM